MYSLEEAFELVKIGHEGRAVLYLHNQHYPIVDEKKSRLLLMVHERPFEVLIDSGAHGNR